MKQMIKVMAVCWTCLALTTACEKNPTPSPLTPSVQTGQADGLYRKGAVLHGSYSDNPSSDGPAKECGILLSIMQSMAEPDILKADVLSENYSIQVRNLEPGKTYFYQAYVSSGISIAKGEVKSFTTTTTNQPVFTELKMVDSNKGRPVLSVGIEDDGGLSISMSGFCWKQVSGSGDEPPTVLDDIKNIPVEQMSKYVLNGLRSNSNYAIRAFGNNGSIGYSNVLYVKTNDLGEVILDGTIDPWNEPSDIEAIIPPAILDSIEKYMPVYKGGNPPNVEGCYLVEPDEAVYCQDYGNGGYEPGTICLSEIIRFFNQNNKTLTIDFEGKTISDISYSEGKGSFISGEGYDFTVYFDTEGQTRGIYTRMADIYSGTLSVSGIVGLYHGFVMVEKGDDPEHLLMDEGVFRLFKDGDGIAYPYEWNNTPETRFLKELPSSVMNSNYWNNMKHLNK